MAFRPVRGHNEPGTYPATEDVLRHLHRNRHSNGLGAAFVKVQGRVLFDPDLLQHLVAEQAKAAVAQQQ